MKQAIPRRVGAHRHSSLWLQPQGSCEHTLNLGFLVCKVGESDPPKTQLQFTANQRLG